MNFKISKKVSVSDDGNEYVTAEIENNKSKNVLDSCCHRSLSATVKRLNCYLENLDDFNLNYLDGKKNLQIRYF